MESIEYLNNYGYNKIQWDNTIEEYKNITSSQLKDTILFALDTENTNFNNERCITYATQLMEFGKKSYKTGGYTFIDGNDRTMQLFTHPDIFWEYVHNLPNQKLLFYVFNAEYDVNNLLNFAIKKYNLREVEPEIIEVEEYDGLYEQKSKTLTVKDT